MVGEVIGQADGSKCGGLSIENVFIVVGFADKGTEMDRKFFIQCTNPECSMSKLEPEEVDISLYKGSCKNAFEFPNFQCVKCLWVSEAITKKGDEQ